MEKLSKISDIINLNLKASFFGDKVVIDGDNVSVMFVRLPFDDFTSVKINGKEYDAQLTFVEGEGVALAIYELYRPEGGNITTGDNINVPFVGMANIANGWNYLGEHQEREKGYCEAYSNGVTVAVLEMDCGLIRYYHADDSDVDKCFKDLIPQFKSEAI